VLSTGVEVELDLEISKEFSHEEAQLHPEALEAAVAPELSGPLQLSVYLEPQDDRPAPGVRESSPRARVEAAFRELDASHLAVRDVLIVDDHLVVYSRYESTFSEWSRQTTSLGPERLVVTG
jgi:hypothetical protein